MTKLLEVRIEGLAGRAEPVKFDLNDQINIFFGLNGSGKTTLLKILHSALDDDHRGLLRVPFKSAQVKFYSRNRDLIIERHIQRRRPAKSDRNRHQAELEIEVAESESAIPIFRESDIEELAEDRLVLGTWATKPEVQSSIFSHRYLPTSRIMGEPAGTRRSAVERLSEIEFDNYFADQIQRIWRLYTNRVLSEVRQIQSAGLADILRSVLFPPPKPIHQSPLEVKTAYERATHFLARKPAKPNSTEFLTFQQRFNEDSQFRSVVQDIDQIERQIEQAEEPRRRLAELIESFVSEGKSITFTDYQILAEVHGTRIPLASLSSGEKQLVRILIEMIMAQRNVILIDEPELSMHIDWQRALVRAMHTVNPDAQIIMATHSPDIMEHVPDECIHRL